MIEQEDGTVQEPQELPEGTEVAKGSGDIQDKDLEKKIKAYVEGLSNLLHSKETKGDVYGMLQASEDGMATVPQTALAVNEQMENAFKKRGTEVDLDVLSAGATFLVNDLVEIGNAGGFFQIDSQDPEVMGTLLTNTMQPWIEKKIKEDPNFAVELQQRVNGMIDEEKGAKLNQLGTEAFGQSDEAGLSQAMQVTKQQGVLEGMSQQKKEQPKGGPQYA